MKDFLNNEIYCWYESVVPGVEAEVFFTSDRLWYIKHNGRGGFEVTDNYWINDLMQGWMRECSPERNKELNKMLSADEEMLKLFLEKFSFDVGSVI